MTPETARLLWQLLEPYHAVVYFAPEAKETYAAAGLKGGWMGYFASRAAPLGAVPAEVVIATFYNFHPRMVRRAIPDAWSFSTPQKVLDARYRVADGILRRLLGDAIHSDEVIEAEELARVAALAADPAGRPLFAAHAALPWPDEVHLSLWHAATLLREFRGDGHVAALVCEEIDGCEAHVLLAATGAVTAELQQQNRGWSEDEWAAANARLRDRGLLQVGGSLTGAGRELHDHVEGLTDRLALPPFRAVGDERCSGFERLMRRILERLTATIPVPYPNPMGLRPPEAHV